MIKEKVYRVEYEKKFVSSEKNNISLETLIAKLLIENFRKSGIIAVSIMDEIKPPSEQLYGSAASPRKKRRVVRLITAIIIILLLGFGVFKLLGIGGKEEEVKPTPTVEPTEIPTPTEELSPSPTTKVKPTEKPSPTPTPKPTVNPVDKATGLDRSKLSIEILNGSGEAGVAKKGSSILSDLGYKISSTGNAEHFNYEKVVIEIKSDKSDFLSLLKKDLSGSYTIGSTSASLTASASADARVIIGK